MPGDNNNGGGKTFAERFANKKQTFTSEALKNNQTQSQNNQAQSQDNQITQKNFSETFAQKNTPNNLKPIDPKKKMQAELIYLVKGIDAGRNAWYYVLIERLKLKLFLKALNDDIIHLENYGKILYSAYGDEPPLDVTNKLKEEYGIQ